MTISTITPASLGGVPAFSAFPNANQTITSNSFTKVQLQSKSFDTANCFDNTTNYRFTPNVAGYYMFSFAVSGFNSTTPTRCFANIYKNGSGSVGVYGNDSTYTFLSGALVRAA